MGFKLSKSNMGFRVYTATAFPSTALKNDIVLASDVPMTNWILSPAEPTGTPRTNGDVWLRYSVKGETFNVLKNGAMMIYIVSAHQYINDTWVSKAFEIYQSDGSLEVFDGFLGKGVNELGQPTFTVFESQYGSVSPASFVPNNDGTFTVSMGAYGNSIKAGAVFPNKIDLSEHTKLNIKYTVDSIKSGGSGSIYLYMVQSAGMSSLASVKLLGTSTVVGEELTQTIDVSSINQCYVEFYISCSHGDSFTFTIKEIYPE